PFAGRVGDYAPWQYLGAPERFQQAIADLHAQGIPVGLYLEGYLVSPQSNIGKGEAKAWERLNRDGRPYTQFAPEMNVCATADGLHDYLVQTYRREWEQTQDKCFYIDQIDFSDHTKICYADEHGHYMGMPP